MDHTQPTADAPVTIVAAEQSFPFLRPWRRGLGVRPFKLPPDVSSESTTNVPGRIGPDPQVIDTADWVIETTDTPEILTPVVSIHPDPLHATATTSYVNKASKALVLQNIKKTKFHSARVQKQPKMHLRLPVNDGS